MRNLLYLIISCLLLVSCSNKPAPPSAAEIELQQMKRDKAKADLKAVIDSNEIKLTNMQSEIAQLTGQLAAANDGVRAASEYQLLRSHSQREADIAAATQRVVEIQQEIDKVKKMYSDGQVTQANLKAQMQQM
jgi:hypothetical protein